MSDRHIPLDGSQEFPALVRRMRAAQKAYFRYQNRQDLVTAKVLEAQVDRWLEAEQPPWEPPVEEEPPEAAQGGLFDP